MAKQGNIRISSENMMPIIKKWLYSDKDIFLREIVANGIDAITKFKKLVDMGEAQSNDEKFCIKVSIDKDAKTLSVEDNGIGMTEDEVEKYITQIAFSGAADFLEKYEKADGDGIIGHFGLGFYSAYMVSENIEIFTKSYKDSPAVRWESDGESTYTIEETDKQNHGTKIVMHISENEKEFLDEGTISTLIHKYCEFMPYDIYLNFKDDNDKPLNVTSPLYIKNPKDCTEEEYKNFYSKTFFDFQEPLFWIHLNMDYPFRLKGILYFPKVKNKAELERGKVKLFCNQVFIADNIKEVIPEFLTLLNGVIDCPDIPLNVSRSFLQNDRDVQKISRHITKKVSDKLTGLFKNDKENYIKCWNDISIFIKVGCLKDEDFYSKVKDAIIYKDLNGEYKNLNEFLGIDESTEIKDAKTIYYVSDETSQSQYINMFKNSGLNAIICDTFVDPHFISFLEYKNSGKFKFARIDAEIDEALKNGNVNADDFKELTESFKNSLKNTTIAVKVEKFKSADVPAIINVSEFTRRFSEMNAFYGVNSGDADKDMTIILNIENNIISSFLHLDDTKKKFLANHLYYLAMTSYKKLSPEELKDFTDGNIQLLNDFIK